MYGRSGGVGGVSVTPAWRGSQKKEKSQKFNFRVKIYYSPLNFKVEVWGRIGSSILQSRTLVEVNRHLQWRKGKS